MWLDLERNVRYVTYVQRRPNLVPHSRRTPASLQPHSRQRWPSDVHQTACRWWSDYIRTTTAPIRPEGQKARGPHVPGECGPLAELGANLHCCLGWWQLHQLSKIKRFLSTDQVKSVVIALVLCRLDQNNALLLGLPATCKSIEKLQRVQNAAARLICASGWFDHSSPLIVSLHWRPITHRITFKILLIVFKCKNDMGPLYLSDILTPYLSPYNTRLSDGDNLVIARTHNNWGDRCFAVASPKLWKDLPQTIKDHSSVKCFNKSMKTHLFNDAYKCEK